MASPDEPPLYHHPLHDASVHQQSHQPLELRPNPPMTPPEIDHDRIFLDGIEEVAKDLDQLVHRLNRRPILQDSLRWHFVDGEERNQELERVEDTRDLRPSRSNVHYTQTPMQQFQPEEPTPALDPIPEISMACDPCPSTIPELRDTLQPPGPIHFDSLVPDAPSDDKCLLNVNTDVKRPRRATDARLHKSASNLRMLGLVTGMIENGVQCNVHNSTPASPTGSMSTSSAIPASMRYIEPQDPIDPHLKPDHMPLEIDMGFSELDEDTMLSDSLALRHASTPAGIRKFGFLRYRSSSEAAQSCKNMKKSVPRMRRRRRTNPPSAAGSSTPTTQPPSTTA
ncbi:hypothetical protein F5B22DRAFT_27973 [Xylaria bambusicola]|uniref:uncharacterized protein n=1 Tax=Xylaria bambusicola TaxID=326684 RepID=UPI0020080A3C|nr:uncharacterized protein F5B22DRAFT_27973 [Xylaria bambusicola]KAI0528242.1 hypothetical protein F5B22DRAFT_27973 [Xylaria bambusicola]